MFFGVVVIFNNYLLNVLQGIIVDDFEGKLKRLIFLFFYFLFLETPKLW